MSSVEWYVLCAHYDVSITTRISGMLPTTRVLPALVLLSLAGACTLTTSPRRDERFSAPNLTGSAERPNPVTTSASGTFLAAVRDTGTIAGKKDSLAVMRFALSVSNIDAVTAAHIHAGGSNEAGPVMVFLYSGPTTSNSFTGVLANAEISRSSTFMQPFNLDSVLTRMRNGTAYVNVHTTANPAGEIRGQIQRHEAF